MGVKNCGKSFLCCQHIKEGIEHAFKTVDEKFVISVPFNCESKNLIHVAMCSGCKEKYIRQTQTMLKERLNTCRQHIWQPKLQQIDVEGLIMCSSGAFDMIFLLLGRIWQTSCNCEWQWCVWRRHWEFSCQKIVCDKNCIYN